MSTVSRVCSPVVAAAVVACSGSAKPPIAEIGNTDVADPAPHAELRVRLPGPASLPPLAEVVVPPAGEAVVETEICSTDGSKVDGPMWAAALEEGGYTAQPNDGGWKGSGPMAVRFRRGGLLGDIWAANTYPPGCRKYVFRFMQQPANAKAIHWESRFSGDMSEGYWRCIIYFLHDARFPDPGDEYVAGDCSNGTVLELTE